MKKILKENEIQEQIKKMNSLIASLKKVILNSSSQPISNLSCSSIGIFYLFNKKNIKHDFDFDTDPFRGQSFFFSKISNKLSKRLIAEQVFEIHKTIALLKKLKKISSKNL